MNGLVASRKSASNNKIEQGRMNQKSEKIRLNESIKSVVSRLKLNLETKGGKVTNLLRKMI